MNAIGSSWAELLFPSAPNLEARTLKSDGFAAEGCSNHKITCFSRLLPQTGTADAHGGPKKDSTAAFPAPEAAEHGLFQVQLGVFGLRCSAVLQIVQKRVLKGA